MLPDSSAGGPQPPGEATRQPQPALGIEFLLKSCRRRGETPPFPQLSSQCKVLDQASTFNATGLKELLPWDGFSSPSPERRGYASARGSPPRDAGPQNQLQASEGSKRSLEQNGIGLN